MLPASFVTHLQNSLTGQASSLLAGRCAGRAFGDDIARGYVTIDTVNNCTLRFPGDTGYFGSGGTGDATNQNVLWGDFFFVTPAENYASGETLVHIEASATDINTSVAGYYTFYGRYVAGRRATTARRCRPTSRAATSTAARSRRHRPDRLARLEGQPGAFTCPWVAGIRPAWYPLGQEEIVIFDEEEQPFVPQTTPVSPQPPDEGITPFPAEAQRTEVNGEDFPVPFDFGWLFLNLNTTVAAAGPNPPSDPAAAQAWVETVMSAEGRYSVGFEAIGLDNANRASHVLLGDSR